jgi:hypothetical protein
MMRGLTSVDTDRGHRPNSHLHFPCSLSQPVDDPASSSINSDGPQQI